MYFSKSERKDKKKQIINEVRVSVVVDLVCGRPKLIVNLISDKRRIRSLFSTLIDESTWSFSVLRRKDWIR